MNKQKTRQQTRHMKTDTLEEQRELHRLKNRMRTAWGFEAYPDSGQALIELSEDEMQVACTAGITRRIENLFANTRHTGGLKQMADWKYEIEGACGEVAVAKCLDLKWNGKGDWGAPDVGDNIEVRQSCQMDRKLKVQPSDNPQRDVFLVTGYNGLYIVRGCINAGVAQRTIPCTRYDEYDRRAPMHWVPQGMLGGIWQTD